MAPGGDAADDDPLAELLGQVGLVVPAEAAEACDDAALEQFAAGLLQGAKGQLDVFPREGDGRR